MKLYVHAFESLHVCLNDRDGRYSGVQHKAFDFTISVGVVKLSVERGFLVLRVYNWGRIVVR